MCSSDLEPDFPFNLTRVGVTGVKKLIKVERGSDERPVVLISNFEVFVDLPSDRKGANLSRNFEAIDEVLEDAINRPVYGILENLIYGLEVPGKVGALAVGWKVDEHLEIGNQDHWPLVAPPLDFNQLLDAGNTHSGQIERKIWLEIGRAHV